MSSQQRPFGIVRHRGCPLPTAARWCRSENWVCGSRTNKIHPSTLNLKNVLQSNPKGNQQTTNDLLYFFEEIFGFLTSWKHFNPIRARYSPIRRLSTTFSRFFKISIATTAFPAFFLLEDCSMILMVCCETNHKDHCSNFVLQKFPIGLFFGSGPPATFKTTTIYVQ